MSKIIALTLPDKAYNLLKILAEKEKIREVTLASALLQKVLEKNSD
jgi:hypothetical protein